MKSKLQWITAGMIGGVYALLYAGVRRRINRMGKERHELNQQRFRIVGEAFGGMKDVKLLGLEGYFVDRFRAPARRIAEYDALDLSLREVPRYVIEGIAFGGLVGFIIYLLGLRPVREMASCAARVPRVPL